MATDAVSRPKQQWPRWPITSSKPVRVDLGPAGAGNLLDISAGGMRVRSLAPLRRGAEIPLRIYVPEKVEPLRCNGIVVWSNGSGSTGLKFINLNETDQKALATWLIELEQIAKADLLTPPDAEYGRITTQIKNEKLNNADALSLIARRTKELTAASGVAIALGTPLNMACVASAGAAPEIGTVIPPSAGLTGECIRTRKVVHCQNAENDPRVHKEVKIGSAVVLPLIVTGEVRGVLEAYSSKPYAFGAKCMEDFHSLADAVIFVVHGTVPSRRQPSAATVHQPAAQPAGIATKSLAPPSVLPKLPENRVALSASVTPNTSNSIVVPLAEPMKPVVPAPRPTPIAPPSQPRVSSAPSTPFVKPPQFASPKGPNFVLELGPDEGFNPPTKPNGAPAQETTYSPSSGSKKWLLAVPVLAAVAAGSVWFVTRQKSSPQAPVAAVVSESVVAPVQPAITEVKMPVAMTPVAAPTQTVAPPAKKTIEPAAPVTESKPAPPKPKPIILAAATSAPKEEIDDNIVVPLTTNLNIANASVPAVPLPATTAVPKLQAPQPQVVTGGTLEKSVQPIYPPAAKMMKLQGEVELQIRITKDGNVESVRKLRGNSVLASAGIDAVKRWKYVPFRMNGVAVEMEKTVKLNFVLPR